MKPLWKSQRFLTRQILVPAMMTLMLGSLAVGEVYAATDGLLTSYGSGMIRVRIYTDYFCAPCDKEEKDIEPLLTELIKKNTVSVTFVDTPIHKETPLYARYFLYIIHENRIFQHALRARAALFQAARENITDEAQIKEFLKKKKIKYKPFDTKGVFGALSGLIKEDRVDATPTVTIYRSIRQEKYTGSTDILKALKSLMPAL